jgi:hypothetical protein
MHCSQVVSNQESSHSVDNDGPLEEIKFWRSRTVDLSGIRQQLERPGVKSIVSVLRAANSSYLDFFADLSEDIQKGARFTSYMQKFQSPRRPVFLIAEWHLCRQSSLHPLMLRSQLAPMPHYLIFRASLIHHILARPPHIRPTGSIEADENLNFLTTLQESCINLCSAAPKDIPAILKEVLTRIRMIWSVSAFFSKVEPLTGLLRKVSNQIIVQVCFRSTSFPFLTLSA